MVWWMGKSSWNWRNTHESAQNMFWWLADRLAHMYWFLDLNRVILCIAHFLDPVYKTTNVLRCSKWPEGPLSAPCMYICMHLSTIGTLGTYNTYSMFCMYNMYSMYTIYVRTYVQFYIKLDFQVPCTYLVPKKYIMIGHHFGHQRVRPKAQDDIQGSFVIVFLSLAICLFPEYANCNKRIYVLANNNCF